METARLILPYINSEIHHDMACAFLAVPVMWLFGFDQVFWPVVAAYILVKFFYSGFAPEKNRVERLLMLYLGMFLVSAAFIHQSFRYVTFARNLAILISSLIFFLSIYYACRSKKRVSLIIHALIILESMCAFAAFLPIVGINVEFLAPFAWLVPLQGKSAYFDVMVQKTFARPEAGLWFSRDFVRPVGLLMYPNCLAGINECSFKLCPTPGI